MTKAVKTPADRLPKKAKVGTMKNVVLADGTKVRVPVILPEVVPSGILRTTRHLDEDARGEAILWGTLELFCNDAELAELDILTMEQLHEAIELANGGAEVPKS